MSAGVVIAGGGLAAQRCSERLRALGYEHGITLVCGEERPPYDRPPLSKEVLCRERGAEALGFRHAGWYADNDVELVLGDPAVALDHRARRIELASGARLPYRLLVLATGAAARRLPGTDGYENVHTVRTAADALRLRSALSRGTRLAIVGAGFIGQEVAASARSLGCQVTLAEAAPVPLAAVLPHDLGAWLARTHAAEGVDVRLGSGVHALHGTLRHVEEIELASGERVPCDELVVAIGAVAASGWVTAGGLGPGPVRVDAGGRTALPGVFAAGDVTGCDHWETAAWQGATVAKSILGLDVGEPPLPAFWSDQYRTRIQCVGDPRGADGLELDGDLGARRFSAVITRRGRPVAALLVGRPRELPRMRALVRGAAGGEPVQEAA